MQVVPSGIWELLLRPRQFVRIEHWLEQPHEVSAFYAARGCGTKLAAPCMLTCMDATVTQVSKRFVARRSAMPTPD